jgi:small nuclear ribonucleoprotein (snRNP)-like protein
MTKILLRLSSQQIQPRLAEFLNKKINIVLRDNTVIFGELTALDAHEFTLKNMRLTKTTRAINEIYELYLEVDA